WHGIALVVIDQESAIVRDFGRVFGRPRFGDEQDLWHFAGLGDCEIDVATEVGLLARIIGGVRANREQLGPVLAWRNGGGREGAVRGNAHGIERSRHSHRFSIVRATFVGTKVTNGYQRIIERDVLKPLNAAY